MQHTRIYIYHSLSVSNLDITFASYYILLSFVQVLAKKISSRILNIFQCKMCCCFLKCLSVCVFLCPSVSLLLAVCGIVRVKQHCIVDVA